MASKGSFHNRMYFLCPHCKKAPRSLPGHLRTACMRDRTEAEIQATVVEAKKELSEFSHKGRFWEYQQIRDILGVADPLARLLEEMQKKGLVVRNVPPVLHAPTLPAPSLLATVPQSGEGEDEPDNEPASEESSGEYYQSTEGPRWRDEVRVEMTEKGLYKKHCIDHPILQGFNQYLHVDLGNRRSKQEVESVSRFMYYMDPNKPNLTFVREVEKVREYFNVLGQTKLSQQTVLNYWKSLKRFMKYNITSTDIRVKDPSLYDDCKNFMDPLNGIRAGMSKKVNRELTHKRRRLGGACSREQRMDERTAFDSLVQSCPVTLDGPPPKRARRQQLCAEHERHCYDRWRSEQLKLRQQRVLEHFGRRQPSEARVDAWMGKQGWTSNVPQASVILNQWEPYGTIDSALDSSFVKKMVDTQRWKGLVVRDVLGKGRVVFTKRSFKQGEVVCEYHGRQVSREEGMEINALIAYWKPGYMFFYKNKVDVGMCVDACEESCQCHPLTINYGRLIRHSCKSANIRPRLFVHNDRDVILFIASRDIPADEQLLFDYGLKKKCFAGEGLVLNWTC